MNKNQALLRNLLSRLERRPDGKGYLWTGVITELEVNALRNACEFENQGDEDNLPSPAVHLGESLDLSSQDASIIEDVTLCIDFGTAMSKAAAMHHDKDVLEENFLEIGLGVADEPSGSGSVYPLHSSLFITDDRIWFGAEAIHRSMDELNLDRKRFDSSKQEISQGDHNIFFREKVDSSINPTKTQFSKGDLVQLYLSFLVDLSSTSLASHGIDDLPTLRFTRPYLADDRAQSARALLRRMLSSGRVMADTLHENWKEGIPVTKARILLDKLYDLNNVRDDFMSLDVLEATAAASGALRETGARRLVLVADIGAGTCDLGLFVTIGDRRIGQMANTTRVLRQAGDRIDELLIDAVLAADFVSDVSDSREMIIAPLRRVIRPTKERLFRESEISVALESDASVTISLADFLASPPVRNFAENFSSKVKECLEGQPLGTYEHPDFRSNVDVVITGGGASLPMIREAFASPMKIHGKDLRFNVVNTQPDWLFDYPDMIPEFPQMSVAIGGAQSDLPTEVNTVSDMVPAGPGKAYIQTQYRGQ
jgi:hypothetical protein